MFPVPLSSQELKDYYMSTRKEILTMLNVLEVRYKDHESYVMVYDHGFHEAVHFKKVFSSKITNMNSKFSRIPENMLVYATRVVKVGAPASSPPHQNVGQQTSKPLDPSKSQSELCQSNVNWRKMSVKHSRAEGLELLEFYIETASIMAAGNESYEKIINEDWVIHKNLFKNREMAALFKHKVVTYPLYGRRNFTLDDIIIEYENVEQIRAQLDLIKVTIN